MDPHNVYLVILSVLVWNFFCIFFPSFSFSLPSAMRQCRCVQSEVQSCPERTLELRHYVRRHFLAFVALWPRDLNFEAVWCVWLILIVWPFLSDSEFPRYNQRHEDPADEAQRASQGVPGRPKASECRAFLGVSGISLEVQRSVSTPCGDLDLSSGRLGKMLQSVLIMVIFIYNIYIYYLYYLS